MTLVAGCTMVVGGIPRVVGREGCIPTMVYPGCIQGGVPGYTARVYTGRCTRLYHPGIYTRVYHRVYYALPCTSGYTL